MACTRWASINGGYDPGGLLDAGWIAFYVLCGTAALHPSMRLLSEPAPAPRAGLSRRRLAAAGRHEPASHRAWPSSARSWTSRASR